ncbi:MAG: peptide chain release factor N(5)-glutamine methyltransferase [Anaerovoracaceae bacterium]|nr:peptide chain release factor N(5)-glutamine methyltransferase [Bacillota bacterium]MDY2670822.1 peptide chain release factor N(5)-glutamine methyltransferase [Anaerovoracaceae bacterium]
MVTSFGEILKIGINRLEAENNPDARLDAELLLLHAVGEPRSFLYVHRNDACDDYTADHYFNMIDRRAEGEPLQYITGSQEFMGLDFEVNESVLIPRQDTETLVEYALARAATMKNSISIMDMCCGSGAIAVSMAKNLPKAKVTACDISEDALQVAQRNASKNGVEKRVSFEQTNMFTRIKRGREAPLKGRFDMILSNPPYIPSGDIPGLQREIAEHEPMKALDGGDDGLDFYRILAEHSWEHMSKKGLLIMEIGFDQADAVKALLDEAGYYENIEIHKDLAGKDRVVSCSLTGKK